MFAASGTAAAYSAAPAHSVISASGGQGFGGEGFGGGGGYGGEGNGGVGYPGSGVNDYGCNFYPYNGGCEFSSSTHHNNRVHTLP